MPTKRGETDPLEFQTWLDHLMTMDDLMMKLTTEETGTIDRLRDFLELRDMLGGDEASRARATNGLWGAVQKRFAWGEAGMTPRHIRRFLGPTLRFGISGMRGWFGPVRARQIFQERTGKVAPF